MRTSRLRRSLQKVVDVKDSEATSLLSGFGALFCTLGTYFLLLPLRDEAGLTLGTDLFPTLFNCSFILTIVATPIVSAFLSRPAVRRSCSIRQLFSLFAFSILAFFVLYHAASWHPTSVKTAEDIHRQLQQQTAPNLTSKSATYPDAANQAKTGDPNLTRGQKAVRIAFYLWLSLLNLLATSTLWARAADVFDSSAASRLFGFLGAGATIGQLAGSLTAAAWASIPSFSLAGDPSSHPDGPPLAPLMLSAVLLETAGRMAASMQPTRTFEDLSKKTEADNQYARTTSRQSNLTPVPSQSQSDLSRPPSATRVPSRVTHGSMWITWDLSAVRRGLAQLLEGFRLIARSGYLCHVCLHFVLHYIVSTFFYFEKTLVVAGGGGTASQRVATFASLNSMSAGAVALIQLTATGHMLSKLGVAWSLTAAPLISVCLMAATALYPNIVMIGVGEILRKVINYSLARPAREILYTVISTEEKYKAKVCIDTIILRMGDSIGAAVFRLLDSLLGLGPAGLAAAAVPLCTAWGAVAFCLGKKQQQLSVQRGCDR